MKICFVAPRLHTNQHAWIDALQERGHEVIFIATSPGHPTQQHPDFTPILIKTKPVSWLTAFILKVCLKIFNTKSRNTFFARPHLRHLYKTLKDSDPDVVIVRDVAQPLSLWTFTICRLLRLRTILYSQHPLETKPPFHVRLFQSIGLVPHQRITPVRNDAKNIYNPKTNTYYVPLITPILLQQPVLITPPSDQLNIIFVGKFSLERKQHLLMLRAFRNILKKCSAFLTMIGSANLEQPPAPLQQAQAYVAGHNLDTVVDIKINIPHQQMIEEYKQHDIIALPSTEEPFSISPIEAMGCGLPVIITDSNGAKGCVEDGETGIVIPSHDQKALEESLLHLHNHENLRFQSKQAHAYLQKNHTADVFYYYIEKALEAKIIQ